MASLAQLLRPRREPQPWDIGQGVNPAQPVPRINPTQLQAGQPAPAPTPTPSISQTPVDLATALQRRQELIGQAADPAKNALQQAPLTWSSLGAYLSRLIHGEAPPAGGQ